METTVKSYPSLYIDNTHTSSISPEFLHDLACSGLLRNLACQVAFIFIASKVIFRKIAMGAMPRPDMFIKSGETEEVIITVLVSFQDNCLE